MNERLSVAAFFISMGLGFALSALGHYWLATLSFVVAICMILAVLTGRAVN